MGTSRTKDEADTVFMVRLNYKYKCTYFCGVCKYFLKIVDESADGHVLWELNRDHGDLNC